MGGGQSMLGTEAFVCLLYVGICGTRGQAPMGQLTRGWFTVHVWVHNLTTAVVVQQGPNAWRSPLILS